VDEGISKVRNSRSVGDQSAFVESEREAELLAGVACQKGLSHIVGATECF
jgi:hypothetical protein